MAISGYSVVPSLNERGEVEITLSPGSIEDYRLFIAAKKLPRYRVQGRTLAIPEEYARHLGIEVAKPPTVAYEPWPGLWDYQRDIARLAIRKEKFAVFADCGLGKSLIFGEFARAIIPTLPPDRCVLIVSPLMVIRQTMAEFARWYGDAMPVEQVRTGDLSRWLTSGSGRIGITNYDALNGETPQGRIGALILDESSMLKSHYGKWGQTCIRLGRGVRWKMCLTGTPAPNDRIEYANHAVFLDVFPTVNSFLARYFVNRGQTENRWEMKPHALRPFYRDLSHWSIFLTSPATYGWVDNTSPLPSIDIHIHEVGLTAEQRDAARETTGTLFAHHVGGIASRSKLARIAKGNYEGEEIATEKPGFIRSLVDSWPDESTIIWARFNDEQDALARVFPDAANISGATPLDRREEMIEEFKNGQRKVLLSKSKLVGFGLNLQVCTRMVFSSLHDSYEEFYQCIKRANRYGSTRPLNVHVPATDLELPMIENVLRKAANIHADTVEQERLFKEVGLA